MKKIIMSTVAAIAAGTAMAWSPVGFSIVTPAQLPYVTSDVYGLRLNCIFGCNENVKGVDIGLAGSATGVEQGLQCGLIDVVYGDAAGLQLTGLGYNGGEFDGLQAAALCNWNELAVCGVQLAFANVDKTEFRGLAFGAFDMAEKVVGAQVGGINLASSVEGLQLGVVNACDSMKGVQLGLVNMITSSRLPVMVLANVWF